MTKCTECGTPVSGREADFECCSECQRKAYTAQYERLGLRPWQEPPCVVDPHVPLRGTDDERRMMKLLRRMFALGVSRWVHDPIAAITAAKKRRGR